MRAGAEPEAQRRRSGRPRRCRGPAATATALGSRALRSRDDGVCRSARRPAATIEQAPEQVRRGGPVQARARRPRSPPTATIETLSGAADPHKATPRSRQQPADDRTRPGDHQHQDHEIEAGAQRPCVLERHRRSAYVVAPGHPGTARVSQDGRPESRSPSPGGPSPVTGRADTSVRPQCHRRGGKRASRCSRGPHRAGRPPTVRATTGGAARRPRPPSPRASLPQPRHPRQRRRRRSRSHAPRGESGSDGPQPRRLRVDPQVQGDQALEQRAEQSALTGHDRPSGPPDNSLAAVTFSSRAARAGSARWCFSAAPVLERVVAGARLGPGRGATTG